MKHIRSNWTVPALALGLLLVGSATAAAQTRSSRVDLFAGYSMMHLDTKGLTTQANNVMGWGASVTNNVWNHFGITFDAGGFYRKVDAGTTQSDASAYSVMAGPTVSFANGSKVSPFIHALAGAGFLTVNGSSPSRNFSEHAFVGAAGGGLDVPVGRSVSIRVVEADYFPVHHATGGNFQNIRWRSGIVFNLGGK
jgi:hypothetical protein